VGDRKLSDKKISELTALTGANVADTDLLPIVDISETETKKITFGEFKTALDTATGFVRITGDTMTGALDVQSTITADGLTVSTTSGDTPASIVTTTSGSFLEFTDGNTTAGRSPLVGAITDGLAFYTSAGSYSQKMAIDASGNVGIGTSSPNAVADLHVADTSDARIWLDATSADTMELYSGTGVGMFNRSNSYLMLGTNNTERMRIDSLGNVGIGVSNPSSYQGNADNLVVGNLVDAGTGITIVSGTASLGSIHFADSPTGDDSYRGFIQYNHVSNFMRFATNATESMRIDASGNLLVGTTTSPAGSGGVSITNKLTVGYQGVLNGFGAENVSGLFYSGGASGGYVAINSDSGNSPLYISLTSSATASNFITFSDSGTAVGGIGTFGGDLIIGTGDIGLYFYDGATSVIPWKISTNAASDNYSDLGHPSYRWKDLYLGGGVYLGGTVAANKLDDYEYGDYQVSLTPSGGGSITVDTSHNDLKYTKIGSRVFISGKIDISAASSPTGYISVTLPFAIHNSGTANDSRRFNGSIWVINSALNTYEFQLYGIEGESVVRIYNGSGTSIASTAAQQFSGDEDICFDFHYETTP
jgi:hypothetical protein